MRLPDGAVNVAASVSKLSPPLRDWRKFIYCESMTGNILGEVDHFQVLDIEACSSITRVCAPHIAHCTYWLLACKPSTIASHTELYYIGYRGKLNPGCRI